MFVRSLLVVLILATAATSLYAASSKDITLDGVNQVGFSEVTGPEDTLSPVVLKAQVLLDRAHFSPGVIDAHLGENVAQAIAAYEKQNGLPDDGKLDEAVWQKLTASDSAPVLMEYSISEEDVAGPFTKKIPEKFADLRKLPRLAYTGPSELLAEKFHMDEDLLRALNQDADFTKAGTKIAVASVGEDEGTGEVATVEVEKKEMAVRVLAQDGKLIAFYPATIGSKKRPAPDGAFKVRGVVPNPTYHYDPDELDFPEVKTKKEFTIAPGPNNPVGVVWIEITKDGYGIHGTPEPAKIGKTYSHGCVRLTNWDALELSRMVKKGTTVKFVGS
jgi:lipoprotein-anchoring transpeptidase ErfK/SrfK